MPVQVSDAKPAAVQGQGLDSGLPAGPFMHLLVPCCIAEAASCLCRFSCQAYMQRCMYVHALLTHIMHVQVLDAKPAAVQGQGLEPGLPSAPLTHLPLHHCAVEADVMPVQVSDAKSATVWGQGLDPGLPSAPFMHLTVCQCAVEA